MTLRWIAQRTLTNAAGKAVRVSLSEPVCLAPPVWQSKVRFEVEEAPPRDVEAHGADAFQALQNGFECIARELQALGDLTWLSPGDTGFARFLPMGLGLPFRRHVEALINGAIAEHVDEVKATRIAKLAQAAADGD